MISTTSTKRYSIAVIREEAINLVQIGAIALDRPLRILFEYLPIQQWNAIDNRVFLVHTLLHSIVEQVNTQQWNAIEYELERHDYLLRDRIIDLVGKVSWESD